MSTFSENCQHIIGWFRSAIHFGRIEHACIELVWLFCLLLGARGYR